MNILITGGTGFVGTAVGRQLIRSGHDVSVVTRRGGTSECEGQVRYVTGDPTTPGDWAEAVGESDAIVNLAGASIFQRWNDASKKRILDSRVDTTRNLIDAVRQSPREGRVLLSASAVGYYGPHEDEELAEDAPPGDDFLAQVTREWEAAAREGESAGLRVCLMRLGIVLDAGGGALGMMKTPFKIGIGGRLGGGRQWFSWIHRSDLARAVEFLIRREDATGPFNFTAPKPVRNVDLAKTLGRVLRRPAILPAPAWAMRLVLGEFANALLTGQRIVPTRLLEMGFEFEYPDLEPALRQALA